MSNEELEGETTAIEIQRKLLQKTKTDKVNALLKKSTAFTLLTFPRYF